MYIVEIPKMAEKKMKNPCWKGYEAYGMKKKNGKEVPNCVPIKESIKENIISNFMENAKPEFARRGGQQHQRPKKFGKRGKAGTERTQDRREGKKQSQQMDESRFFDMGADGVTRGLGRNWGVEQEDSPDWQTQQAIKRMETNRKWAMQRLMPVYEKHGMAEEHAGTTDEYGFPQYGHAITHPNFRAFVDDFIAFHTAENKKHWKQHGKASSYHWPAILRARQGLQSLERREAYLKAQNNTPGDISEEWENREQQRMHAPHEDPMIPGGEHDNYEEHDPYPHVSEAHRYDLERAWNEGMKHGHEHAELMAHANLHGVIDAITRMHAHMEGASHEWNAKHAARGLEKIAQHLAYHRKFLDKKFNERMKKDTPDPHIGDIPF
jgi:hypothetical protein